MYYYGFKQDGACVFSADAPVEPEPDITIVTSDTRYDIQDIVLRNGVIVENE